jgi:phage terminase large subunit-like protein/ribosomal protein S27AE
MDIFGRPGALELAARHLEEKQRDPRYAWRQTARADQLLPTHPFRTILWLGGRGSGKTRAGSQGLAELILEDKEEPGEWGIVAPTYRDSWTTCVEGESGIIHALGSTMSEVKNGTSMVVRTALRSYGEIRLHNGAIIRVDSANDGALRVQGKNLKGVWIDEIGLIHNWQTAWDESIAYAVRRGESKIIATGTPKVSRPAAKLIRRLISESKDGQDVVVRKLSTRDNLPNLSVTFFNAIVSRSKGTRLERQELEGELLEDVDGALWTREILEANRVEKAPQLIRVVVAMDPAVTSGSESDETGIIVAGEAEDGHGYILADLSIRATPQKCMERVVAAYHQFQADRVIGEANNGGDYIGNLLHAVDPNIPYKKIIASRGKQTRAEPISALYEQGRVHHVGVFIDLEDQMTTWVPGDADSPDRSDALVWACTELKGLSRGSWADAYGVTKCAGCGVPFVKAERQICPRCGTPVIVAELNDAFREAIDER